MSGGKVMSDTELKQWLGEVFPVVARAVNLPRPAERAANQGLEAIPAGTALRWVEMLRIGRPDEIRLMAQNVPDAAEKLRTPEGRQAIRNWEADHGVVPVLRALEQAVKTVLAFWRTSGQPRRAVIRALAALGVSPVVPQAAAYRGELADVIGTQSETVSLIDGYAAAAVADESEKIENVDRLISRNLPLGAWVRSLWVFLKLKVQASKRNSEMGVELGHPLWRLSLILREVAGRGERKSETGKDSESDM